jgi:ATP-dependent DNA helicase UvrD/PcrA
MGGVDVRDVLQRLASGTLAIARSSNLVARWQEIEAELARLNALPDLQGLVDDLFPAGIETVELLREIALGALASVTSAGDLAVLVRSNIAQPEVPTESADARVMSFHKSKGLTADVVVLAGLVEGLMPFAARAGQTAAEREADLEEYRRLFYVGLTRTRDVLALSTYSWLPAATARRLGVAHRLRGGGYVMTASRFLAELGHELPDAVDGALWRYP